MRRLHRSILLVCARTYLPYTRIAFFTSKQRSQDEVSITLVYPQTRVENLIGTSGSYSTDDSNGVLSDAERTVWMVVVAHIPRIVVAYQYMTQCAMVFVVLAIMQTLDSLVQVMSRAIVAKRARCTFPDVSEVPLVSFRPRFNAEAPAAVANLGEPTPFEPNSRMPTCLPRMAQSARSRVCEIAEYSHSLRFPS